VQTQNGEIAVSADERDGIGFCVAGRVGEGRYDVQN
jgi:hypothetical protein